MAAPLAIDCVERRYLQCDFRKLNFPFDGYSEFRSREQRAAIPLCNLLSRQQNFRLLFVPIASQYRHSNGFPENPH